LSSNTNELGNFKVGEQFSVDGTTGEVTINTNSFNLSGLNAVGPFSRNGGLSTVGVQLQEVSNNPALIASTGAADGNTVPTQSAVVGYLTNRTISTGSGLTGGGNLAGDRTINLSLKADGGVVLESNQVAIDLGASNITGTLGFSDGGTGATSQAGARTALAINNVDNTSDTNKPISTATQTALDAKLNTSSLGVANGAASLDSGGKVPSTQLPSYVDDVLEFAALANFPATGETGKIYIAVDNGKSYRWSGTIYVEISTSEVNSVAGKTGVVSLVKADVGLGNVDNTSDANKPISTATQTALDLKANTTGTNATGTWGISITGNAATATNGVVTTGSYADPAWITSLSASKLSGPILLLERAAQTAAYTLALADAGQVVVMGASTAVTLTIPADDTVAFAIGTVIVVYNTSASTLTIAGATSPATVTVRNNSAGLAQYQEVSLRKRATNEWVRVG
jgi:hypothetical protein